MCPQRFGSRRDDSEWPLTPPSGVPTIGPSQASSWRARMSVEGLHRGLLAIPGGADAFVEGEAAGPPGGRAGVGVAADRAAVGPAVQRLPESRGMTSRVAAPAAAPPLPPVLMAAPDLSEA